MGTGAAGTTLIRDVVIVVPGIMGSELLSAEGHPIWSLRLGGLANAVRTVGASLRSLELPKDIGDKGPPDGVRPGNLLSSLHVIPGIWSPVTGYDGLLNFLSSSRFHLIPPDPNHSEVIPNLIPFPYDWRLSNRFNARQLAEVAIPALKRWRTQPGMEESKLVLVCHSMGGLIARWFIEQEGGFELVRSLITIGTPFRGSVKALDTLVNGLNFRIGPLRIPLTKFARSLPSLHQLLPQYNCLVGADEERLPLTKEAIAGSHLDPDRLQDSIDFHKSIAGAKQPSVPGASCRLYKAVGIRQPTLTTAVFRHGAVDVFTGIDSHDQGGDGTVPRIASEPEMGRGTEVHAIANQHGELQATRSLLDFLDGILTGQETIWQAPSMIAADSFGIEVPDYILVGQPIPLQVVNMRHRLHATLRNESGHPVLPTLPVPAEGVLNLPPVPEGGYRLTVAPVGPAGPHSVSKPLLVWNPE